MSTRMLIDARHPEETRVTVVKGNRVEEFDYETSSKLRLKGNIYLAKVTRVEPSLQAAFVDYGGNRHGFLAFSEIHPDYYQIPVADREAILAEEAKNLELENGELEADAVDGEPGEATPSEADNLDSPDTSFPRSAEDAADEEYQETLRRRRLRRLKRRYKIQEVIKRRQILLVQVVKEERGNKGAALTTYLSIPGRYCVLMPNTTHTGGISRKISNVKDRRRLRSIMDDLKVPDGMGCIIRTAGTQRTKAEIKRDFDYLVRLWDGIRETTLKSVAPTLIYEEGDLVKRSIRDLYDRSIDEVLVEGEEGYKGAKEFMKLLIPSHTKRVRLYKNKIPLFHRYQVESQLEEMFHPVVTLKSGGYIVLNPTEALISIDVNSGRSTREHNIEETALKTNLEAATEIAKQLRIRDLAGLIVIDFIDMEHKPNVRQVERKMRDAVKGDRARIQLGRISNFGLMEISRQRLRPNLFETATEPCVHCEGTGRVRSVASSALHVLRAIEEECIRQRCRAINVEVPRDVAIFLLNQKRRTLSEFESNYGANITIGVDESLVSPAYNLTPIAKDDEDTAGKEATVSAPADKQVDTDESGKKPRRRRRGGKRRGRGGGRTKPDATTKAAKDEGEKATEKTAKEETDQEGSKSKAGAKQENDVKGKADTGPDKEDKKKSSAESPKAKDAAKGKGPKKTARKRSTKAKEDATKGKKQPKAKTSKPAKSKSEPAAAKSRTKSDKGEPSQGAEKQSAKPASKARRAKPRTQETKPASAGNGKDAPEKKDAKEKAAAPDKEETKAKGKTEAQPKKRGWWNRSPSP